MKPGYLSLLLVTALGCGGAGLLGGLGWSAHVVQRRAEKSCAEANVKSIEADRLEVRKLQEKAQKEDDLEVRKLQRAGSAVHSPDEEHWRLVGEARAYSDVWARVLGFTKLILVNRCIDTYSASEFHPGVCGTSP